MANLKFDECFLKNTQKTITVNNLLHIHDTNIQLYFSVYSDDCYCPVCFQAKLSFVANAKTPHFRSINKHLESCEYNFKATTKKQAEDFYSDTNNRETINRMLRSCIDSLYQKTYTDKTEETRKSVNSHSSSPFIVLINSNKRRFRKKRITAVFHDEDYNIKMIFYGKVLIKWEKDDTDWFLIIKNNAQECVCKIKVTGKVYYYIDDRMKFSGLKAGKVAFIAEMKEYKGCNSSYIRRSSDLMINLEDIVDDCIGDMSL
ncbi:MAG: hypothetical protein LBN34_06880 [Clostridiales Family XIII bacterium]|nr:hypothetical protein [Clostridiales Family XIII bacterium]